MTIAKIFKAYVVLFFVLLSSSMTPSYASASMLNLPSVPMPINVGATANIFLAIDDSGSMDREILMPLHFTTCLYNSQLSCSVGTMFQNIYDQENPASTEVASPPASACAAWDTDCDGICDADESCTSACETWDTNCNNVCDLDEGGGSWDTNCNGICDSNESCSTSCAVWDTNCNGFCDVDERTESWDLNCNGVCDAAESCSVPVCEAWDTNCNGVCDSGESCSAPQSCASWDDDCDGVCDWGESCPSGCATGDVCAICEAWDSNCNGVCDGSEICPISCESWDTNCDGICDPVNEGGGAWDTDCNSICDLSEGGGAWDTNCNSICDLNEGGGTWDTDCDGVCDLTEGGGAWDTNCNSSCDLNEGGGAWDTNCDSICDPVNEGGGAWDTNCNSSCDLNEGGGAWDTDCDGVCDLTEGGGDWDTNCNSVCDAVETCTADCETWDLNCNGTCDSGEVCDSPPPASCGSWDDDCDGVCDWGEDCPDGCALGDTCSCEAWDLNCDGICDAGESCTSGGTCLAWDTDCDGICDWNESCPAACVTNEPCVCQSWDDDCDGICDWGEDCPSSCATGDPCTESLDGGASTLVISLVPPPGLDEDLSHRPLATAFNAAVSMSEFEYMYDNSDNIFSSNCGSGYESCETSSNIDFFDWRARSSSLNAMFFNPQVAYLPWVGYGDADFAVARSQPVSGNAGYSNTRNLAGFIYHYWIDDRGFSGDFPEGTNATRVGNEVVDQWDSHIKVTVDASGYSCDMFNYYPDSDGMNLVITSITLAECAPALGVNGSVATLQQNVANWYQYYRKRTLATKAALATVITGAPDFRYGLRLMADTSVFVEMPADGTTDYVSHNTDMVNTYLTHEQSSGGGTPLRRGLEKAGDYYAGDLSGVSSPIVKACQQNFTIQFTDGFWNGGDPGDPGGDFDGDGGSIDSENVLLADVAKYFYDTDLAPAFDDVVPTTEWDTASHQHMVTYTIGFGISGSLSDSDGDGWPNNFDPFNHTGTWYLSGATDDQRKVDDLWHTAWNGRGDYYSATNPEEIALALADTIERIGNRVGTSASAVGNGSTLSTLFQIFQAKFDSNDWHGELSAIAVVQSTAEIGSLNWEAGALLDAQPNSYFTGTRKVITWDSVAKAGSLFTWSGLNAPQRAALDANPVTAVADGQGEARLNYIRGSNSDEGSGNFYRERIHKLGDMVHSDLQYVARSPFFYGFDDYQAFRASNADRQGVVYAGANDGMLHAFREDTGAEIFAYAPAYLIGKLNQLTRTDYEHDWYVDGPIDYGDAYINGAWKSVLVGSLRSGGQAVYALDITDPLNFSASNVLWEFSDINDVDMGYVIGRPQIKKMANGKWAVIFGSGYNSLEADGQASATGDAYVFVLFIEDGIDGWSASDYVKIAVPGADGLTAPAVADVDGDALADFIYLGDLNGNMWKIDVTSTLPSNWAVAFSGSPLFTATSASGGLQPITERPVVKTHPFGITHGALILFGTGKYLEITDDVVAGVPTQSVYGIWDRDAYYNRTLNERNNDGARGFNRNTQLTNPVVTLDSSSGTRIIDQSGFSAPEWYDVDGNPKDRGWVADLPLQGERIIQRTIVRDDLLFFVTMIPEPNVCTPGSTGWLMVLDANTGGAPVFPVFDINDDLVVDSDDVLSVGDPLAPDLTSPIGVQMPSMPNLPLFVYEDRPAGSLLSWSNFPPSPNSSRGCGSSGARTFTYTTQADGSIAMVVTASQPLICGRQSWFQQE